MLEKPAIADEALIACIRNGYGIPVTGIEFLPIGNDATAWVYRVDSDSSTHFLKVKRGALYEPAVLVPRFLRDGGIEQIVAPLPARTQTLWTTLDEFTLILSPFIAGEIGGEVGLSDDQWIEHGATLKRIHTTRPSPELLARVPHETFALKTRWLEAIKTVERRLDTGDYHDNAQQEALAALWSEKRAEITQIVDRTQALGRACQQKAPQMVICHADIHTHNLLVGPDGGLHIVDWDETLLAPVERDLMFVADASDHQKVLFYQGYGATEVDALPLAYYRHEWCVQEFGDYGERVFLNGDSGEATRQEAVRSFLELFEPGDVVEAAHRSAGS